jgi:hypothetical protein
MGDFELGTFHIRGLLCFVRGSVRPSRDYTMVAMACQ